MAIEADKYRIVFESGSRGFGEANREVPVKEKIFYAPGWEHAKGEIVDFETEVNISDETHGGTMHPNILDVYVEVGGEEYKIR